MDFFTPQMVLTVVLALLGYAISGAIVWGAIRNDIANIHREIAEHKGHVREDIKELHNRVDTVMFGRRTTDKNS